MGNKHDQRPAAAIGGISARLEGLDETRQISARFEMRGSLLHSQVKGGPHFIEYAIRNILLRSYNAYTQLEGLDKGQILARFESRRDGSPLHSQGWSYSNF